MKVLISILLVGCSILGYGQDTFKKLNKLPALVSKGDTILVTTEAWIQKVKAEVDQRMTIKYYEDNYDSIEGGIRQLKRNLRSSDSLRNTMVEAMETSAGEYENSIQALTEFSEECKGTIGVMSDMYIKQSDKLAKTQRKLARNKKLVGFLGGASVIELLLLLLLL